ncbi:MAG: nuclear transport factor 2 family protein [Anaerolineae bacterium]|nr:nuclear transport factor 2 family protein [Anaerolineae bacterium]
MKTRLITITTLVLVLTLPVAVYAQETDPAAVVLAGADSLNAGDVDMAFFADDAVVNILLPGAPETYTGKEEIRAWLEGLVAQNFQIEIEILEVEGDTVTARSKTWSDPLREMGVAPLVSTAVYIVQDGKLTSLTYTPTEESVAKLQAAMAALPVTGGAAPSSYSYALVMALGGLAVLSGLGLALRRRRSPQQG